MPIKTAKIEYVSIAEATTPRDGEVLTNRWWVVHPEHGITFYRMDRRYRAPQCNSDERISRHICDKMYPGHDIQFIPAVYTGPAAT